MKNARVYQSSGVTALDEAALRWTESARFDPAEKDHAAVEGRERFRIKFQWRDGDLRRQPRTAGGH
jgi:TonB family protein